MQKHSLRRWEEIRTRGLGSFCLCSTWPRKPSLSPWSERHPPPPLKGKCQGSDTRHACFSTLLLPPPPLSNHRPCVTSPTSELLEKQGLHLIHTSAHEGSTEPEVDRRRCLVTAEKLDITKATQRDSRLMAPRVMGFH